MKYIEVAEMLSSKIYLKPGFSEQTFHGAKRTGDGPDGR